MLRGGDEVGGLEEFEGSPSAQIEAPIGLAVAVDSCGVAHGPHNHGSYVRKTGPQPVSSDARSKFRETGAQAVPSHASLSSPLGNGNHHLARRVCVEREIWNTNRLYSPTQTCAVVATAT